MKTLSCVFIFVLGLMANSFAQSVGVGVTNSFGVLVDFSTLGEDSKYGVYVKLSVLPIEKKALQRFGLSIGVERGFEIADNIFSVGLHTSAFYNNTSAEYLRGRDYTYNIPPLYSYFEGFITDATLGIKATWQPNSLPLVVSAYFDYAPILSYLTPTQIYDYSTVSKAKEGTYFPNKLSDYTHISPSTVRLTSKEHSIRLNNYHIFGVTFGYKF